MLKLMSAVATTKAAHRRADRVDVGDVVIRRAAD
jgi:hypothetical protein